MRRTRRSQWMLRAKALSMEAFFSAEVKISRATSRMWRNCRSRAGDRSDMDGIIETVAGCQKSSGKCAKMRSLVQWGCYNSDRTDNRYSLCKGVGCGVYT